MSVAQKFSISAKDLLVILSFSILLWFALIKIDRSLLAEDANSLAYELNTLHAVVALRFSYSTNIYLDASNTGGESDLVKPDSHLNNYMEMRFASACNIWQLDTKGNMPPKRLPKSTYRALSFKNKLQFTEYCDSILELEGYVKQTKLRDRSIKVIGFIPNPSFIAQTSLSHDEENRVAWLINSQSKFENIINPISSDFWAVENIREDMLAQPILTYGNHILAKKKGLFGIPYGKFYQFDQLPSYDNGTEVNNILTNINDHTRVNSRYIVRLSPLVLLVSLLLFFLTRYLHLQLKSMFKFNMLFRLNSFALIRVRTESRQVKVIASNLKTKAKVFEDDAATVMLDSELQSTRSFIKAKYVNVKTVGEALRFSIVSSSFMNDSQEYGFMLLVNNPDIQNTLAEYQSIYRIDALTGLPNRTVIEEISTTKKPGCAGYLMAIMDLDHFKQINDTYGHLFGDLVLKQFADFLRQTFGLEDDDHIVRIGGEEFMLLLEISPEKYNDSVDSIAKRINAFNQAAFSVSGGVVFWQQSDVNFDIAYKRADDLLYQAKRSGRKQVIYQRFYDNQQVVDTVMSDITPMKELDVINLKQSQRS